MTITTLAIDEGLAAACAALPTGESRLRLTAPGGALDALLIRAAGKARGLVVVFHGAMDRSQRQPPVLIKLPPLHGRAHVLAVADPSLELSPDLRLAWYLGHEGFATPEWVVRAVAQIRQGLGVGRTVYFGASGGGFAALAISHRDPGSVAVAGNPQTVLERYSMEYLTSYMQICQPAAHTAGTAPANVIATNLGEQVYRRGHENFVIYVQSSGDRVHFERQMIPFVAAMRGVPDKRRFILHSDYWGQLGHVLASDEYLRWIDAVLDSKKISYDEILTRWYRRASAAHAAPPPVPMPAAPAAPAVAPPPPAAAKGFAIADLATARRLAEWAAAQGNN